MNRRSHEPVFWLLFGAGGVVSSLMFPVLIFVTGIGVPLGILPAEILSYDRAFEFAGHWPAKLVLVGVIALPLWHAAHRIYHGLHDLGVREGRIFFKWLCYGLAGLGSSIAVLALIRI